MPSKSIIGAVSKPYFVFMVPLGVTIRRLRAANGRSRVRTM